MHQLLRNTGNRLRLLSIVRGRMSDPRHRRRCRGMMHRTENFAEEQAQGRF